MASHGLLPRLNDPYVQICIVSATLFVGPGLYLAVALIGAGGGRATSLDVANISNGALYGCYAVAAPFVGPIINLFGPRWTLLFGMTGYPIYQGSLWYFTSTGYAWFPYAAGAYLGLSAACLWVTATYTITAYPEERVKGRWRAIQWCFIMTGSSVGGIIALSLTWNTGREGVPNALYIIFISLQCCALVLCFLVRHPKNLRRSDGTELAEFRHLSVKESFAYTGRLLTDWRIICLVPAMFAPEMFFPLQSHINGYAFNLRTRELNSFLNSIIQLPIGLGLGYLLDSQRLGDRRRRALYGIALDVVWITGAYIAQTAWLASWNFRLSEPGPAIDVTDPAYAGAVVIYIFFAAQYALFQNVVIYVLGAITNDPRKAAALSGLLVGLQSSGTAVSFGVSATSSPLMGQNIAYFVLTTICWPLLAFVVWKGVTVTTYTIEVTEGVMPPANVAQELHIEKSAEANADPSAVDNTKASE